MTAADRLACVLCRRPLEPPPPGGSVECPQCGEINRAPAAVAADVDDGDCRGPVCPHCGAPVDAAAAACGACGELLGSLVGDADEVADPREERSLEVGLLSIAAAAGRDWKRRWLLLGAGALSVPLLYALLFGTQCLLGAGVAVLAVTVFDFRRMEGEIFGFLFGYGLGALAALPLNVGAFLGLAGLHLAAARGQLPRGRARGEPVAFSPMWRTRGKRRTLLCVALLTAFGVGLHFAPIAAFYLMTETFFSARVGWEWENTVSLGSALWTVGLLWLLYWPLLFVIADRPDQRHVKPLWFCLTLPRGRWGAHLATGFVAGALLLAGPGLPLLIAIGLEKEGPLFLALPLTCVLVPLTGLILAHAYDRLERARTDEFGPRSLDPEGVI